MKYLIALVFICFTSVALATYIDHDPIFVYNSDKKLTDAELKKLADNYYIERAKNQKIVTVTYKKETMKGGVVYHYTVKNDGWDEITQIKLGDMYLGETHPVVGDSYDIDVCAIKEYTNIRKIKSNSTQMMATLENNDVTLRHCLMVDSQTSKKPLLQNQSITISVYLSKDEPKFATLHWVASFSRSDDLAGLVKKSQ